MKQITPLDCDAALCAAEKPNAFTISIVCRPLVTTEARAGLADLLVMI
jgi:hypothetical protein